MKVNKTLMSRPPAPTKKNEQAAARKKLEARGLSREELERLIATMGPINAGDALVEAAKAMLLEMPQAEIPQQDAA